MPDEIEIGTLKWHEVCEGPRLQLLLKELATNAVREPIHVDSNTSFILDGAHRSQACQILGMETIPVHLLSVQADVSVPGWIHSLAAEPTKLRFDGAQTGPLVATYRQNGNISHIRARSSSLEDVHEAFWAIAQAVERYDPIRVETPAIPDYSIEWSLPKWGQIVEIVQTHGPLPAGVSRLGSIFAAECQACCSSAGRHAGGQLLGDAVPRIGAPQ